VAVLSLEALGPVSLSQYRRECVVAALQALMGEPDGEQIADAQEDLVHVDGLRQIVVGGSGQGILQSLSPRICRKHENG
jgi:hypothetical protein